MSWSEKLNDGTAKIEIIPCNTNYISDLNKMILYVEGVYLGEFPSYTQASEYLISLINDFEE